MQTVTPTELRKELFRELQMVANGSPLRVRTKKGNVVIVAERAFKPTVKSRVGEPRVLGRIVGDLDEADKELKKHLKLPG